MLKGVTSGGGGLVVGTTAITGGAAYAVLREDGSQNLAADTALRFGSSAAGHGLQIAAGTAVTDVAALSITRTNNNAAVATGVKITFTDTASAAGFLPFQVLGGAAGTTNLLSVDKSGNTTINGYLQASTQLIVTSAGAPRVNGVGVKMPTAGVYGFTLDTDSNSSLDAALSRVSAGVVGVGTGAAGSVAGTISAAAFISGGSAGVDFGPGVVTSITIKKGIVTACS